MSTPVQRSEALSISRVIQTWWPLAASWMLMGVELPAISAVLSRLANPDVNLAAYGSVVFPLALAIESPIIMLLAASTALSKDWDSYRKVRRFMMAAGLGLTVLHAAVAFTPLFDLVVRSLLDVPSGVVEPARLGLRIMTPWSWAIAYRRFHQGVLIRFGRSRAVGAGTVLRLLGAAAVLVWGFRHGGNLPGIAIGAAASAVGVLIEAIFIGCWVQPVVRGALREAPPVDRPLTVRSFLSFYIPLSLTSALGLLVPLVGSAGMSRMPMALASLATWPVLSSLVFLLRGMGIACNEVVVALIDEPFATRALRRFRNGLATFNGLALLVIAASPLAHVWTSQVMTLAPELSALAHQALWIAIPLPAFGVFQAWFQGVIVHSHRTRAIPEAMLVFLGTICLLITLGVLWGAVPGIFVSLAAIVCGQLALVSWLWWRSRDERARLTVRDMAVGHPGRSPSGSR